MRPLKRPGDILYASDYNTDTLLPRFRKRFYVENVTLQYPSTPTYDIDSYTHPKVIAAGVNMPLYIFGSGRITNTGTVRLNATDPEFHVVIKRHTLGMGIQEDSVPVALPAPLDPGQTVEFDLFGYNSVYTAFAFSRFDMYLMLFTIRSGAQFVVEIDSLDIVLEG